jgi:hypothetical protein
MFARPVPLKQNPKVSRGVEAPRGRSRRLMSLSCGDVPYRSMTDFGAKLTSFGLRESETRRRSLLTRVLRSLVLSFRPVAGKKTVRLAFARAFPRLKSPRAVSSGSCARVRSRDAAFVGPQSETCLYWSVGKRGLTILVSVRRRLETARRLVPWFFVLDPRPGKPGKTKLRRALLRGAAARPLP